jgi:hypothetical protein
MTLGFLRQRGLVYDPAPAVINLVDSALGDNLTRLAPCKATPFAHVNSSPCCARPRAALAVMERLYTCPVYFLPNRESTNSEIFEGGLSAWFC